MGEILGDDDCERNVLRTENARCISLKGELLKIKSDIFLSNVKSLDHSRLQLDIHTTKNRIEKVYLENYIKKFEESRNSKLVHLEKLKEISKSTNKLRFPRLENNKNLISGKTPRVFRTLMEMRPELPLNINSKFNEFNEFNLLSLKSKRGNNKGLININMSLNNSKTNIRKSNNKISKTMINESHITSTSFKSATKYIC